MKRRIKHTRMAKDVSAPPGVYHPSRRVPPLTHPLLCPHHDTQHDTHHESHPCLINTHDIVEALVACLCHVYTVSEQLLGTKAEVEEAADGRRNDEESQKGSHCVPCLPQ